jgi:hypothetical protein
MGRPEEREAAPTVSIPNKAKVLAGTLLATTALAAT